MTGVLSGADIQKSRSACSMELAGKCCTLTNTGWEWVRNVCLLTVFFPWNYCWLENDTLRPLSGSLRHSKRQFGGKKKIQECVLLVLLTPWSPSLVDARVCNKRKIGGDWFSVSSVCGKFLLRPLYAISDATLSIIGVKKKSQFS